MRPGCATALRKFKGTSKVVQSNDHYLLVQVSQSIVMGHHQFLGFIEHFSIRRWMLIVRKALHALSF